MVKGKKRTSVRNGGKDGQKDGCSEKVRKDRNKREWKRGRQKSK